MSFSIVTKNNEIANNYTSLLEDRGQRMGRGEKKVTKKRKELIGMIYMRLVGWTVRYSKNTWSGRSFASITY